MATASEFENISILIVEDNAFLRDLIKRVLRGFGIVAVREAENGAKGLQILEGTRIDVVICDIEMEQMNGIQFLEALRAGRHLSGEPGERYTAPSVPVIMLTSHADAEIIARVRDAGANGFLLKPVVPKRLLERLRWVLGRK